MAPRGFGTIAAMVIYGRIANRVDTRALVAAGLLVTGGTLYAMSGWPLIVGARTIMTVVLIQGFGMGFIFAPLTALAFSSLPPHLRTEASGFSALIRNMGASVGISIIVSQLTELTQSNHARLAAYITPFRHMPALHGVTGTEAMEMLNLSVTQQAGMIAYVNVFRLLAMMCVAFAPVLLFMRPSRAHSTPAKDDATALAH
jgi:DHA2 family multidrug resistance protein